MYRPACVRVSASRHARLGPIFTRCCSSDECAISAAAEAQGTMAGVKGSASDPNHRQDTQNTTSRHCRPLSGSTETISAWPWLVKVDIIAFAVKRTMDSARVKLCPLCHSGPGWQRHTNTQRASNVLEPSGRVSSVLQRHHCCPGSTLGRQWCLFCGPWQRWVVCRATPAFSDTLL